MKKKKKKKKERKKSTMELVKLKISLSDQMLKLPFCRETKRGDPPCHYVWGILSCHECFLATWQSEPGNSHLLRTRLQMDRPGRLLLSSDVHGPSLFYQTREVVSGFHLFVVGTFLHVPRTHCGSFIAWNGNVVPSLYAVELNVI